MTVRVDLVSHGMRELLGDPGVEAYLLAKMAPVEAAAIATAPVGKPPGDPHPGEYKASIRLYAHRESSGRVVARVEAGTDHAFLVEAKHGTLGRAMDAARA